MIRNHFPYLDKVLSFLVVSSFILMIAVVVLQILARYALPWSPNWTEEMARFCFIYMVSLGAGLAVQDRGYVSVNTLLDKLSPPARKRLEIIILIFVIILMLTMFVVSIPLAQIVSLQISPAMQLNMSIMYVSMSCMGLFVSIYSILQLLERIKTA
ncbi:TRAP transporter small permease [Lunatibacter salilacus]|uniref:TRAP transporter small permease n=1 Tax=Lunatibacter salilacus TaxID=2483804 RepID=UPI00131BD117|nr:TRAP transporter small permease [Lunatibacter salilacus]